MSEPFPHPPLPDPSVLQRLLESSPRYSELADPDTRRRHVFDALANSDDPMWREIGQQLRDGRLRPRDLLGIDAYAEKIQQGLAANAEQFHANMAEAAAELQAEQDEGQQER